MDATGCNVSAEGVNAILHVLGKECGFDITGGNLDAISQCIVRRLQSNRSTTPEQYAQRLREDPRELNQLYKDLLQAYAALLARQQDNVAQPEQAIGANGNLPANTDVGTILLDRSLRIQAFTPRAVDILHQLPQHVGQRFGDIAGAINGTCLTDDLQRVLQGEAVAERQIENDGGHKYLMRVLPHYSGTHIDGVAITFVGISEGNGSERECRLMSEVFMDAADPLIIEDLHGIIIFVNREATRSYGWSREELLGNRIEILAPETELIRSRELRARCRNHERARNIETSHRCKSGQLCTVLLTLSLITDNTGTPVAIASNAKDISAQRKAETLAREALKRRDQFLAMLSHELRNPLGAVLNATYVLDENCTVRKACKSPCQVIQRQTHQMSRLLDDLLDVTRVTQGKIEFVPQPVDMHESIETVLTTVRNKVQQRKQDLQVDVDPRPMMIHGDATRLQQIQANLLTNAIKYTPPGGKISLRVFPEGEEIVLSVLDTGEGIPADMLECVFDLFVQARATLDRSDGGMGVGLTLVKQLVELHGGTVSAHSDGPGKGTEFVVRLPAYRTADLDEQLAVTEPSEKHCGRILIVEDNADSRDMLKSLLEIYGYQVAAAADGFAGLDLLQNHDFDLALVDIGLPGIDGYEVARTIRRDPKHDGVRLVALTGYGADADRRAVIDAGFDNHLIKPLRREDLDEVLPREK